MNEISKNQEAWMKLFEKYNILSNNIGTIKDINKNKKQYESNKENLQAYQKEYQKEYIKKNKEKLKEYQKLWREKNPEYQKEYQAANKEKIAKKVEKNRESKKQEMI